MMKSFANSIDVYGSMVPRLLLITLIAGQQFVRWEQSQQQDAALTTIQHPTQTHFSAVSSSQADSSPMRMMDVDQAQPGDEMPRQERWVF